MVPPLSRPLHGVKGLFLAVLPADPGKQDRASPSWLIIIKHLGVSGGRADSLAFHWCPMGRFQGRFSALIAGVSFLISSAALADSRIFIIANQADGYGIDQCLARGDKCGASAARAYCQSREFAQATSYRRVDPDEITGAVPHAANQKCHGNVCGEYVAITCQR
ncbi:hypothetical protein CI1B_42860 [Bradyrhizobium ivorense]|uniref:Uncharacterized protein n=2 Tax=Bradyrhizobium ivorense TaxID=2511166 RepID=A0A508TE89_9BRAD|nr:hypothetical protein CI1B_42860 [Bradyrhizobium ivorense]